MSEVKEVQVNKEVLDKYDFAHKPTTEKMYFPIVRNSYNLTTITVAQVEELRKKGVNFFTPKKTTEIVKKP